MSSDQRIVVVTGGGAGIGAGVAEELGRQGAFVVTLDPLLTLDGSAQEQAPAPENTTAGRIVAGGGAARAVPVSVTDAGAVRDVFAQLVDEFGRLDAVVNVAGISRPTNFASGSDDDWRAVLSVHVDGYLNVLRAALPIMADAGRGQILGVTSGGGWRPMDAGAYGCAKRAVAALTWQVGLRAPDGVVVNAMSPIAVTRMVTAALERAGRGGGAAANAAGPLFGSMPKPEDIGPIGAYLVGDQFTWSSGEIVFAGGAEVAIVERPRLLEVVRTGDVKSLPHVLDATTKSWIAAEASQLSGGGSNPRFATVFDEPEGELAVAAVATCCVMSDDLQMVGALKRAVEARGVTVVTRSPEGIPPDVDAVIVTSGAFGVAPSGDGDWQHIVGSHDGIVEELFADGRLARTVCEYAAAADRSVRLVTLTAATTPAGRTRAQAVAQHARSSRQSTRERVTAFGVSVESDALDDAAALAAHLVAHPDAPALSGAELAVGDGWVGLRSHPRPNTSVSYGGPAVPAWLDGVLRDAVR
ncbi:MAG: hypothetical protein QOJ00_283 [Actinomycetota bacterium]